MKINQKKLEVYRKSHSREIFSTKEHTYDIVIAQFICEKKDAEVVSVDGLAEACGFDHLPVKEEDSASTDCRKW